MDPANIQAMAAFGAMLLALVTLIGGWMYWLVRDLREEIRRVERDLREEIRRVERDLREEMHRNHREQMTLLQYHTHGDDGLPMFHQVPDPTGD